MSPGLVPALQLERELHVLGDRSPVEQAGLLERHAVVLVQPRRPRRLAVRPTPRRWSVRVRLAISRSCVDFPQPGGTDQRDELARPDHQVDVDEGLDRVPAACVEHLRQAADLDRFRAVAVGRRRPHSVASRGRFRIVSRSTSATIAAISSPSAAAPNTAVNTFAGSLVASRAYSMISLPDPSGEAGRELGHDHADHRGRGRELRAPGRCTAARPGTAA